MVEFGKYNDDLAQASKDMEVYFRTWTGGSDPILLIYIILIDHKMKCVLQIKLLINY